MFAEHEIILLWPKIGFRLSNFGNIHIYKKITMEFNIKPNYLKTKIPIIWKMT